MDRQARKEAAAAWKDRPVAAGIYAVRQGAAGPVWVGASPTLGAVENRLRFTLRAGGPAPAELRAAWAAAGGEGFSVEVLERLDPELVPLARETELKARLAVWRDRLGALAL